MSDGSIVIDTRIDSDGAEKGVKGLGGKLGSLAKGGLGLFVKGIAVAGTALAAAGVASVKLASDLGEVQNVVDTTFGKNAGKINTWSKDAATSFGIGELAAKQMTGTMGAMLKSMGMTSPETLKMSEGITGLSGDLASFYNLDTKDAFEKIRAGISGETEPLKQLGINMSVANLSAYALAEGISKPYAQMTQAEQTTLRYNYLMKVTADAQGDFAKTSGSLANQLRIAKLNVENLGASIGTSLLPIAQDANKKLNGFIKELQTAFDKGGFEGLAGALGNVIAGIITYLANMLPKVVSMAVLIIQSLVTGLQSNLPAIATAAVAIITSLVTAFLTLLPQLMDMGLQLIGNLAMGIGLALPTLIPLAIQCIMSLVNAIITNLPLLLNAGLQIITGLVTGILTALPQLIAMLPTLITSIVTFITTSLPVIIQTGATLLLALINGLVTALPQLLVMLPQIIDSITTVISTNLPVIVQAAITILLAIINGLVTALPQLITAAIGIIQALATGIIGALPQMIPAIINIILGIVNMITANLGTIIDIGIELILALVQGLMDSLPMLLTTVPKVINDFANALYAQLPKILKAGLDIIWMLIKGIIGAIPALIANLPAIIMAIVNVMTLFSWASLGKTLFTKLGQGLSSMAGSIAGTARSVAQGGGTAILNIFKGGLSWGKNFISSIGGGFSSMGSFLASSARSVGSGALNAIKGIFSGGLSIGKNLITGIWNGIGNMKSWILSKIGGFAGSIISGIKSAFDIHSPSGIMRDLIGKNLVKGIGVGIDVETPNLERDIDKNMNGLVAKMQASVGSVTADTTASVVAQHNFSVAKDTQVADATSKANNNQTFIAKLIVDGKEFTQTVVAPNQGVLDTWGDGR